ncbi:MAG TPA: hypothetical protein VF710_22765 [Longimicrobium sp.]|jgi:hypothetical protein
MSMSEREQQFLEQLANADNGFTEADREALVDARVPVWCLLAAAAKFVRCGGPTNPDCLKQFAQDVVACF